MNYIILIIVGIAGIVLGTYLGRRRTSSRQRPYFVQPKAENKKEGGPFDEDHGKKLIEK